MAQNRIVTPKEGDKHVKIAPTPADIGKIAYLDSELRVNYLRLGEGVHVKDGKLMLDAVGTTAVLGLGVLGKMVLGRGLLPRLKAPVITLETVEVPRLSTPVIVLEGDGVLPRLAAPLITIEADGVLPQLLPPVIRLEVPRLATPVITIET